MLAVDRRPLAVATANGLRHPERRVEGPGRVEGTISAPPVPRVPRLDARDDGVVQRLPNCQLPTVNDPGILPAEHRNGVKRMADDTSQPVSCDMHDRYEAAAVKKQDVEL